MFFTPFSLAISDVFLACSVIFYLWLRFKKDRTVSPHITPVRSFLFFLTAALISALLSVDRWHSLVSLKELRPFFILLILPFLSNSDESRKMFLYPVGLFGIFISLICTLYFLFPGIPVFRGKFVSGSHLTLMSMQTIIFAVPALVVFSTTRWRLVSTLGVIFLSSIAFLDANIPLFMVIAAASLLSFILNGKARRHELWIIPLCIAVLFALTGRHSDNFLLHLLPGFHSGLIQEARSLSGTEPVFGAGYNAFSVMNSLAEKRAFSDFITAYVNMGMVGATAFIVFLLDLMLLAFRAHQVKRGIGTSSLIFFLLYFVLAAFNPMFFTPHGLRLMTAYWCQSEIIKNNIKS